MRLIRINKAVIDVDEVIAIQKTTVGYASIYFRNNSEVLHSDSSYEDVIRSVFSTTKT